VPNDRRSTVGGNLSKTLKKIAIVAAVFVFLVEKSGVRKAV